MNLSDVLKKHGHKVIPFSMAASENDYSPYSKYFINKVDVNNFNVKNAVKVLYNYDAARRIKKIINKERPDIAHLHNIAHQISPAIIRVLRKYKIPIVQTLHDYKLICPNYLLFSNNEICYGCEKGRYYNCLLKKCVKNSQAKSFLAVAEMYLHKNILKTYDDIDLFIAPSQFMKDVSIRFGVPENKIKVIYNFIDSSSNSSHPEPAGGFRTPNEEYLLYFGRLSHEKGVDNLIEAMGKVSGSMKLKIAGSGTEFKKLEDKIKALGLESKIELVGQKFGQELISLIEGAKAVVIPSIWLENMPFSMLEAMAQGKVVIASRAGGIGEIISDGENGFLFDYGNIEELAKKMRVLDEFDLKKIGQAARKRVLALNSEQHYKKIMEVYEEIKKLRN